MCYADSMWKKPSPIAEKLIKDIAELRKQIEKIQEKLDNPNLFEQLEEDRKNRP